jgi:hypothetical protein
VCLDDSILASFREPYTADPVGNHPHPDREMRWRLKMPLIRRTTPANPTHPTAVAALKRGHYIPSVRQM